jgi:hypothetical protein
MEELSFIDDTLEPLITMNKDKKLKKNCSIFLPDKSGMHLLVSTTLSVLQPTHTI